MRRTTVAAGIAVLAIAAAACTPQVTVEAEPAAISAEGETTTGNGIAVSGTGEVSGTPDTLTMTFGVSVLRDTVAEAVADAAALSDAVISSLQANGVAEEDIQTANFSIYPDFDYSTDEQRLRGYQVNNSVVAKIRDVDSAGRVIDAAAAAGGDEVVVSGVSFSIDDDTELVAAARANAWENAEATAQQLADLAGVALGEPVTIAETLASILPPTPFVGDVAFAAEEATPIEAGQQQVVVTLTVRFAIDG